jgi:hypothetical protein
VSSDQPVTPLLQILQRVEQELHAKRRDIEGRLAPIEQALSAYRRALEEESAHEFARNHSLRDPDAIGIAPRTAAIKLMRAVGQLPELASENRVDEHQPSRASGGSPHPAVAVPRGVSEASPAPLATQESTQFRSIADALPQIVDACDSKKLIIAGALAGRKRPLPEPLDGATEWIDTEDGGAHAIGNIPTRIRQGRIFGVIICDQAISHKHSEPLMAAARSVGVPIGFAAKGGGAAIGKALKSIEQQLAEAKARS